MASVIKLPKRPLVSPPHLLSGPDHRTRELYRRIYIALNLLLDLPSVVVGVTSAIRGEGRTTTALGLAQTLAADLPIPVTLVEADLEHPSLTPHLAIQAEVGFCEVLRGECHLDDVAQSAGDNLTVITAGRVGPDATRLLYQLPEIDPFHADHPRRGIVILDLPPLITSSYSPPAAGVADATILVVRATVTPVRVVREAIARLEDRPPRGVVLTGTRSSLPSWWPGQPDL